MNESERLVGFAPDPGDAATVAIAGAMASAAKRPGWPLLRGMQQSELVSLLDRRFPGAREQLPWLSCQPVPDDLDAEFQDVLALLLEVAEPGEDARALACAVASAALFDNHLWEDLQLPRRAALSEMLNAHFGALAARNTRNMRWKAFFYKQLCERAELVCRAPTCDACNEYSLCFGSEEERSAPGSGQVPSLCQGRWFTDAWRPRSRAPVHHHGKWFSEADSMNPGRRK